MYIFKLLHNAMIFIILNAISDDKSFDWATFCTHVLPGY